MDEFKSFINRPVKARVELDEEGNLYSLDYQDCYGPKQGHILQSEHVFWGSVRDRLTRLGQDRDVVLGELGFGVGVNFLTTWKKWSECRARGDVRGLTYVGFEGYPISRVKLQKVHSKIFSYDRDLLDKSRSLIKRWTTKGGYHLYHLDNGVRLLLVIGSVERTLSETGLWDSVRGLEIPVFDAWFLDGFSPKCNPDMYSREVCELIAKKSTQDTVVASYSVSGGLRRNLEKVGFRVDKKEGFADKKHCLQAVLSNSQGFGDRTRYFKEDEVFIVGSGIAALACVKVCQNWGIKTRIISNNKRSSSNIPTALVTPGIPDVRSEVGALKLMAFSHATRFYDRYFGHAIKGRGSIHTLRGVRARQYQRRGREKVLVDYGMKFLDSCKGSSEAGYLVGDSSVFWGQSMNLCAEDILSFIDIDFEAQAEEVKADSDFWLIKTACGTIKAKHLILACGDGFEKLSPYKTSVKFIYQKTQLGVIESTPYSRDIKRILMGSIYITPTWRDKQGHDCHTVGSRSQSIELESIGSGNQSIEAQDYLRNEICELLLRDYNWNSEDCNFLLDFVGVRVKTNNRMPFCRVLGGKKSNLLYAITGLGGHGYTWSPLLAEIVVSQVMSSVSPVPISLQKSLAP